MLRPSCVRSACCADAAFRGSAAAATAAARAPACAPCRFRSPLLAPCLPRPRPPFHPAVDVFSFGLLLHYCLTAGKHPFGAGYERDANILQRRLNLKHLQHLPEAANLVRGCCAPKGALRCVCWGRTPGWSLALAGGRDLPHTCPGAALDMQADWRPTPYAPRPPALPSHSQTLRSVRLWGLLWCTRCGGRPRSDWRSS